MSIEILPRVVATLLALMGVGYGFVFVAHFFGVMSAIGRGGILSSAPGRASIKNAIRAFAITFGFFLGGFVVILIFYGPPPN